MQPKPKRPFIQLFLLGVLLLVFPIGSYIYLQRGYDYQLASWNEIDPLGDIAGVMDYSRPDSTLDIVFFAEIGSSDSVQQAIRDVHEAFDDNPSVRFVGIGGAAKGTISDPDQLFVLEQSPKSLLELETALNSVSVHCNTASFSQRAYLVDRAGQIRRCYDLHKGSEVNRLVEQLALLIPRPKA